MQAGSHHWPRQPWQSIASTVVSLHMWLHFTFAKLNVVVCLHTYASFHSHKYMYTIASTCVCFHYGYISYVYNCIHLCMFPYGYISYVNICKIASSCVFADVYICKNTYVCNISVNCMHMCTLTNLHLFVCLLNVYYIC